MILEQLKKLELMLLTCFILGGALTSNVFAAPQPGDSGESVSNAKSAQALEAKTSSEDTPENSASNNLGIQAPTTPPQYSSTDVDPKALLNQRENIEAFRSLDEETELLLKEVLNLGSDLVILNEEQSNPTKYQLLVMVTLQAMRIFKLDYVELRVDNDVVAAYQYSDEDILAMHRGGGHRLYLANLPAGMHELQVLVKGQIPRDPDYRREAKFKVISGVSRNVVELYVNSEESNGFPTISVREWN